MGLCVCASVVQAHMKCRCDRWFEPRLGTLLKPPQAQSKPSPSPSRSNPKASHPPSQLAACIASAFQKHANDLVVFFDRLVRCFPLQSWTLHWQFLVDMILARSICTLRIWKDLSHTCAHFVHTLRTLSHNCTYHAAPGAVSITSIVLGRPASRKKESTWHRHRCDCQFRVMLAMLEFFS